MNNKNTEYKFLSHTADVKFRAYGTTLSEMYKNSIYAVTKIICKDKVKSLKKIKVKVKGHDNESLLYNLIEEIIYLTEVKNFIPSKIVKIKINKSKFILEAEIIGDKASNYDMEVHIKAPTYNEMYTQYNKRLDKWVCQVVLDV